MRVITRGSISLLFISHLLCGCSKQEPPPAPAPPAQAQQSSTPQPAPAPAPPEPSKASLPSTSPDLEGTSWQLVKFQGGDGTTLTPDDSAKYTIAFAAGGQLTARIDCNRGRGTWKSDGANQLLFGPLALTRAQCPAGSLHDQIVKQWGYIRSYVVKAGHLYLSLMADGGIYEFEPVTNTKP